MSTTPKDAATVLFGRTRRQVLSWLYGHADERYYLRHIVRQTGAAHGAVQRELQLLADADLIRRTAEGQHVYFQANTESPIFGELQAILRKTAGLADVIRDALTPLSGKITAAFVYGSAARGELRSNSDVDVLVVGNAPFADVANALSEAQARLGRDVNPTVYPPAEFLAKVRSRHHFLTTVLREPRLFVMGGPDEAGRLGAERLAPETSDEPERDPRPARGRGTRPGRQRR